MVRRVAHGSFAAQLTRPKALDDPTVQVARVAAVSVVSPSRGRALWAAADTWRARTRRSVARSAVAGKPIGYGAADLSLNPSNALFDNKPVSPLASLVCSTLD